MTEFHGIETATVFRTDLMKEFFSNTELGHVISRNS